MPALEARAGQWELIVPPSQNFPATPAQESAYLAQWGDYFSGSVSTINTYPTNGAVVTHPTPVPSSSATRPFWKATSRRSLYENAGGIGGAAQIIADGKVRCKVHWKRNLVNGVPDPIDNPPRFVYLMMNADVKATATDGGGPGVRDPSKEGASVFVAVDAPPASPAPGYQNLNPGYVWTAPADTGFATVTSAVLSRAIKIDVAGREEFWTPWIKIVGFANLPGNRSVTTFPGGASYPSRTEWRNGGVSVMGGSDAGGIAYGASLLNLTLSPSPDNPALDEGSSKLPNRFLINEGIPTSISVQSSDTSFTEYLRVNSSWSLSGPKPSFRPHFLPVSKVESNGTAIIRPRHPALPPTPNPTPTPEWGWKFAVQTSSAPSTTSNVGWNFPADNAQFGVKTFSHIISGNNIDAPVSLFYPSEGFQHPTGGPDGVQSDNRGNLQYDQFLQPIPAKTPNWFYYYNQAWPAPGTIKYTPVNFSYYEDGESFVRIGDNAHFVGFGRSDTPLYETRNGKIEHVGYYDAFGLDVYARNIAHEFTHKRIYDTYSASIRAALIDDVSNTEKLPDGRFLDPNADFDEDKLPNGYEESLGLDPMDPDTFDFVDENNPNNPYKEKQGDSEVVARWEENKVGLAPDRMKDWASDGLNFGAAPSLNHARIQKYGLDKITPLP